jgi:hypothetical protein
VSSYGGHYSARDEDPPFRSEVLAAPNGKTSSRVCG